MTRAPDKKRPKSSKPYPERLAQERERARLQQIANSLIRAIPARP